LSKSQELHANERADDDGVLDTLSPANGERCEAMIPVKYDDLRPVVGIGCC
jgi:hypothetical protein